MILFGFYVNAGPKDCMCTENVIDCRVGKLTCSGQFIGGKSTLNISDSQVFGPDDGFIPSVSMRSRDYSFQPQVFDISFYASSCDGIESKIEVGFTHWMNVPPDYVILGRDRKNFVLQKDIPTEFELKINENHFTGRCLLEQL